MVFNLLLFLSVVYGCAISIAELKVGKPLRSFLSETPILKDLVRCPPCLSFWIALGVSYFVYSPLSALPLAQWQSMFLEAFAALAFSDTLHVIITKILPEEEKLES